MLAPLAALVAMALVFAAPAWAKRMALVVGNAEYSTIYSLANPVNDATALSDRLDKLGFDVTLLTDSRSADFWTSLSKFTEEAAQSDVETVLFFFAGHAFQLDGINYLVPSDAQLTSREAIRTETWDLDAIISRLNSPDRQTLIFLDACRNNPLPESLQAENQGRNGLARLQTGRGTFVAFATEPNNVTFDGDETAGNSPFTTALLSHIETPGISISDMMIKVRNQVQESTFERQTPWDQSSLNAQFYFKEPSKKRENGFGAAELELLAALPEDQRAQFLALLSDNGIKTNFDEDDIVETIVIKSAPKEEEPKTTLTIAAAPSRPIQGTGSETVVDPNTGQVLSGPGAEKPEGTEVAALSPDLARPPVAPLVDIPVTGPSEIIGRTAAVEVRPGIVAPSNAVLRGGVYRTLQISALQAPSLPPDAVVQASVRVEGSVVETGSDEARAILQDVYPTIIDIEGITDDAPVIDPKELAKLVQGELDRLGCYRLAVDGDWGRGSKTAAARYYAAKAIVPTSLEPSVQFHRQLQVEQNVVCATSVAKDRRVAQYVEEKEEVVAAPVRRTLKAATPEQAKETKKKLGLRPGVFR